MRSDRQSPDDPREWINRAQSDLAIARTEIADAYLDDLCYHAQQAVEKALKAVLLKRGQPVTRTHDLADLAGRLQDDGMEVPDVVLDAVFLTEYAVAARYPGLDEPVTEEEWRGAVAAAHAAVAWAAALAGPASTGAGGNP